MTSDATPNSGDSPSSVLRYTGNLQAYSTSKSNGALKKI